MSAESFTSGPYIFRPAKRDDLPMLERWLHAPEVVRWWGDPQEQLALLSDDLNDSRMSMWIVAYEEKPFAYVQDYEVHAWPQHHFSSLPFGSRGIDAFIGESSMLGVGHGTAFLRAFTDHLRAHGAPVLAIDPDPSNLRARRAYEKIGFSGDVEIDTEWGHVVLMTMGDSSSSASAASISKISL